MKPRTSHGQRTLSGEYFTSPEIWRLEQERIFRARWLLAGHVSDLRENGSYLLCESGHDSVIVLRDNAGRLRAHHNFCRHRGTRLCEAPRGHLGSALRCAYHAWSYDLDGTLQNAPHMNEVAGFDKAQWGLKPVALAEWRGFVFVNLSLEPPPLVETLPLAGRFERWPLENLRAVHQTVYETEANWKLFFHNYSECYHCPAVHPQLNRLTPFRNSENDLDEGPMLGGPMLLNNPQGSMTTSGERCAPPFGLLTPEECARVYYYTLFPSAFLSLHPDYVLVHRVQPLTIGRTRIVCDWYFDAAVSMQPGFNPTPAIEFWDLTNRQDWALCANAYKGVASGAWEAGPYSELESQLAAFDRHYLQIMGATQKVDTTDVALAVHREAEIGSGAVHPIDHEEFLRRTEKGSNGRL